ncbi:MAG: hypothetical protein AAFZ52_05690 [Bacteroidota bacterium]
MQLLKLTPLFLCLFLATACGEDDEAMMVCAQTDWTGTYTGTVDCDEDGTEPTTITILADGTNNILISHTEGDSTISVTTEYDPLPFDGCDFTFSSSEQGLTLAVDAELNGDELVITETFSFGGESSVCTLRATRD